MAAKVTIKDGSAAWLRMQLINLDNATRAMADATVKTSKITAPMSAIPGHKGTLRNSSRIERISPLHYAAMYGGENVPYAGYQERGMRRDGSRKVRHYTTPGTGKHFLKNAGDAIAKQGIGVYL